MESHSNDSRDSGDHWWYPSFSNITPHHRRPLLLSAAGETRLLLHEYWTPQGRCPNFCLADPSFRGEYMYVRNPHFPNRKLKV